MNRNVYFNSPFLLGFDHLERLLERTAKAATDGYPPYNIEELSNDSLRITLAVAGFSRDELNITVEDGGVEIMRQYGWPGNIRELQNIIERLVIISEQQSTITAEMVGGLLNIDTVYTELFSPETGLKEIVENLERKTIEKVLTSSGSTRNAAKILKIDQSTIVKKAKKLGIKIRD